MGSRYDVEPGRVEGKKDIIEHILSFRDRVAAGESSLRIGHTAIEDGNLVVRNGDIVVSETDGTEVLRIRHGAIPEIQMWPLGSNDTHTIRFLGFDFGDPPFIDQAVQLYIAKNDLTPDGGKLLLTRDWAVLSHQPDGLPESFIGILPTTNEGDQRFYLQGRFADQLQRTSEDGLYPGSINVTSGFGSFTHTYFTSFTEKMCPIVTLVNTGGVVSWMVTAFSNSSFTVTWSGTAAKVINFFNFRL